MIYAVIDTNVLVAALLSKKHFPKTPIVVNPADDYGRAMMN